MYFVKVPPPSILPPAQEGAKGPITGGELFLGGGGNLQTQKIKANQGRWTLGLKVRFGGGKYAKIKTMTFLITLEYKLANQIARQKNPQVRAIPPSPGDLARRGPPRRVECTVRVVSKGLWGV